MSARAGGGVGAGARPGLVARAFLACVHGYQHARAGRPSPCRYFPSCSSYAVEAIEVHGAWRGTALAVRRLGRCHPWGGHGIDLVPEARPGRHTPAPTAADGAPITEKRAS